jgi:D-alanyl-D-alanine carboxypeptidase
MLSPFLLSGQTFDAGLAQQLQNKIDSLRIANNLQGISASVIYPGQGMWQGVTGDSYAGNPITTDMEFGIASNTKLFTAVLTLKLADAGLINLDDSLHEWLPGYPNVDSNITIRQLMNHTSGLADINNVVGYSDSILTDPYRVFQPAELMTWIGPPLFAAGTSWSYSNTNYIIAGMIIETATGQSYGQVLHDSILSPLSLDSTFLHVYDSVLGVIAHPWQSNIDQYVVPRYALNSAAWSAGGMYSNSSDMAQWYYALMNGQVLSPWAFSQMTTFTGSGNYGCGLYEMTIATRTVWEHGGTIWGGYNSQMVYDTATGAVICVLINENPAQAFPIAVQLLQTIVNYGVGIQENELPQVQIYPIPVTDELHIDMKGEPIERITLFSVDGRIIAESDGLVLQMSSYPNGIYFIRIQTDRGDFMREIVKQ